jgi:integrase
MGVYPRGKVYWISYTVYGKQYHESSRSAKKRDAVQLLRVRQADAVRGIVPILRSRSPHLNGWLSQDIETRENARTRKRYECSQKVLERYFGDVRLCDISPEKIEGFIVSRREEGVTAAGTNRDLALLRSTMNRAVNRGMLPASPFKTIKLLNESKERKPPHVISFVEEARILSVCDSYLRVIFILLVETGLRVGIEALHLKWDDLDLDVRTVTVRNSKTVYGLRTIPLTELCATAFREWSRLTSGISPYVFFNPQNPSMPLKSVKKSWATALRLAGVPHFPIYNCRHTFATRLLAAGVSDGIVSQMLGHSRQDVLRFYAGIVAENWRDAIRKLEALRFNQLPINQVDNVQGSRNGVVQ